MTNKNILLVEPGYKNKYPPLGLMKIAQYHGINGKKDNVRYIKGEDKSVLGEAWDRVYITTLFSFEWSRIARSIDFALQVVNGQANRIFVGGIAASLLQSEFISEPKWRGIRFIKGLLGEAPATSLQLDPWEEEIYSDDLSSLPIEDHIPDYSILDQIEYKYPVSDAYFTYASRGCIRKCKFCGVPDLEGGQRDTNSLASVVEGVSKLYGEKKDLILMDNNVVASVNFKEIISEIVDLGFEKGATLKREFGPVQRRVDFNQGVDARILCKDPAYLQELSKIAIKPLRIAFDHLGLKKPYAKAIRYSADAGLTDLSNYMLYNFHDSPGDLFERMRLNVTLNEDFGIRIFSFPMRYQPVNRKDRGHIGPKWNKYFLRSMQIVLQATHGIVSGAPKYFRAAFGDTQDDFNQILMSPHHFIFNRYWYDNFDGKPELEDYQGKVAALSKSDKDELLDFLCAHNQSKYENNIHLLSSSKLRDIAHHYVPLSRDEETKIWEMQKLRRNQDMEAYLVAEDELVEDAALTDEDIQSTTSKAKPNREKIRAVA